MRLCPLGVTHDSATHPRQQKGDARPPIDSPTAAPRGECALDTLETLRSLLPQHALEDVLRKCPQLLNADIGTWEAFFSAYGAADTYLPRLIQRAPRFFLTACLFSAGNVLLTFRALGIDPEDALEMVVLDTPGVLNVPSEQVAERIGLMRAQGLSNAEIADAIMRNPMEVLC